MKPRPAFSLAMLLLVTAAFPAMAVEPGDIVAVVHESEGAPPETQATQGMLGAVAEVHEVAEGRLRFDAESDHWYAAEDFLPVERAVVELENAVQQDPEDIDLRMGLVRIHTYQQNVEKLLEDYAALIELSPETPDWYAHRAELYRLLGDQEKAQADYDMLEELAGEDPMLSLARAQAEMEAGNPDEAMTHYDRAIEQSPEMGILYFERGLAHEYMGNFAEALADFELSFEKDPADFTALSYTAWVLATAPDEAVRDGERAVELARRAIDMSPDPNAYDYDTLAAALAEKGDYAAAVEAEQTAIQIVTEGEGDQDSLIDFRHHLELYKKGEPFHMPAFEAP